MNWTKTPIKNHICSILASELLERLPKKNSILLANKNIFNSLIKMCNLTALATCASVISSMNCVFCSGAVGRASALPIINNVKP